MAYVNLTLYSGGVYLNYLEELSQLVEADGLSDISTNTHRCLLHEDHRWVLPIILQAQLYGDLPSPCDVIMFDAHDDAIEPACIQTIADFRNKGLTTQAIIDLCHHHLKELDDDWVKAGMELGLIRDIVIFGVEERSGSFGSQTYTDHLGDKHKIRLAKFPNRGSLGFKRELSDVDRSYAHQDLWDLLGWVYETGKGFDFAAGREKVLLDFDLDCFLMIWKGYYFSWADKVFEGELLNESNYHSTDGWSGQKFIHGLIKKAGLITIARETEMYSRDNRIAEELLQKMNHYMFDNQLNLGKTAVPK